MPILTCPTCGSKLEVVDDDIGHLVQCGSCQGTFTAEDPTQKKNDGASRKPLSFRDQADEENDDRPSRRRRDDDEDDRPSSRRRRDDDEDDDPDDRYRRRSRDRDDRDDDDRFARRYGDTPRTGMGIASMCLGIGTIVLACIFPYGTVVTAILGIIFGIISLKTAGRGMGIAGVVTSIIGVVLAILFVVAVFMFMFANAGGGPGGGGGGGGGGAGGGF